MKKNVGHTDSIVRIALAAILIVVALFLVEGAVLRIVIAFVAAVLAATSFMGMCPIYHMLGKNTCDVEGAKDAPAAPVEPEITQPEERTEETAQPEETPATPEETSEEERDDDSEEGENSEEPIERTS